MSAIELRRRLGDISCGDVLLRPLGEEGLPLPRAPDEGREEQFARAREWMSPKHDA
ncbi:MAG TPA: hypothetical protein VK446_05740 [Methylocystis sp.]|nr:hypothetical protein [Methylocystis sp.]